MRPLRMACWLLLLALAPAGIGAQGATPDPSELQSAAAAFSAGDWATALTRYEVLARRFPAHWLSRFRVGVALLNLGRPVDAEVQLREGERLGAPPAQAGLRLAEALAQQRRSDAAIVELRRALAAGLVQPASALDANARLAPLHGHPEWQAVVDAFDTRVQPCRHDPRHREFDFWVGDWNVWPTNAVGVGAPSRNNITLEENGCVVQEHWEGQGGSTGQSFNLFDHSVGKWRQTWVDNTGGQHDYAGALKDGNMVLEGTTPAPNGALGRIPTRLTLFHVHADTVRQFSQISADSGRTWTVAYDLTYVRKKP